MPTKLWAALAVAAFVALLTLASDVFLLVFAAALLAVFLRAISDWLADRTPLSPGWALGVVSCGMPLLAIGFTLLVAPEVANQVQELRERGPQMLEDAASVLGRSEWSKELLEQGRKGLEQSASEVMSRVVSVFQLTLSGIIYLFFFVLLGVYFAAEATRYRDGLIKLLPARFADRARDTLNASAHAMRWWLIGQMASMTVLGIVGYIGLTLFDIPLALTIALTTALLTFIPTIGPAISAIPPLLLALSDGPLTALYVLIFWWVMQIAEGSFMTPMIQREAVDMPPGLLLSMQLLASALLGFAGLALAAPMTAVGMVLTQRIYIEGVLGKSGEESAGDEAQEAEQPDSSEAAETGQGETPNAARA